MESKSLAAWLGRKDSMSILSAFVSIFIRQVEGRGKKDVHHLKEITFAIGKGVGESEAGPAWGEVQRLQRNVHSYGLAVGSSLESPRVRKKRRLLEFDGVWLK